MIKPKGLEDYLKEDPSLTRKTTLEEFEKGIQSKGESVEEAYEAYLSVLNMENR